MNNEKTEREAFEEWATSNGNRYNIERSADFYTNNLTHNAYCGWQARAAHKEPVNTGLLEALKEHVFKERDYYQFKYLNPEESELMQAYHEGLNDAYEDVHIRLQAIKAAESQLDAEVSEVDVERVARAMWNRRRKASSNYDLHLPEWEQETEALREDVRAEASEAINAMRVK